MFDLCAGINSTPFDLNNARLFPNPFIKDMNLTTNIISTVCIYDIYGKLAQKLSGVIGTITMGESLRSGMYYVEVITSTNKKIFSVIKSEY